MRLIGNIWAHYIDFYSASRVSWAEVQLADSSASSFL